MQATRAGIVDFESSQKAPPTCGFAKSTLRDKSELQRDLFKSVRASEFGHSSTGIAKSGTRSAT